MIRFFNILFVLGFVAQQSAWASGLVLPHAPQVIESIVANYNSLSKAERAAQMKSHVESNLADQKFLKEKKIDLLKIDWPELKYEDGVISFEREGETIEFKTDKNTMEIRGEKVQVTPGKLGEAVSRLEEILGKKTTSVMDLILSSAYAFAPLALALIAIIAVAVWGFVLKPAATFLSASLSKLQCYKMKSEFQNFDDAFLSQSDAQKIRSDVNRILSKTNSDLAKADCSKDPGICSELRDSKKCYEFVMSQVEQKANPAINNSERSSWKDYLPWSGPAKTAPGATSR